MNRIAQFEKVSFKQFYEAIKEMISNANIKGNYTDEQIKENIKVLYDKITLPERATKDSAGYDIKSPIDFELPPYTSIKIPTGIRVKMEKGWVTKQKNK